MEVDTGAAVSILSNKTYRTYLNKLPLKTSNIIPEDLHFSTHGSSGECEVQVSYKEQNEVLLT